MDSIEQKLDEILRELAHLREQVDLARNDSQKFAINLDKEIKSKIDRAAEDIIRAVRNK